MRVEVHLCAHANPATCEPRGQYKDVRYMFRCAFCASSSTGQLSQVMQMALWQTSNSKTLPCASSPASGRHKPELWPDSVTENCLHAPKRLSANRFCDETCARPPLLLAVDEDHEYEDYLLSLRDSRCPKSSELFSLFIPMPLTHLL